MSGEALPQPFDAPPAQMATAVRAADSAASVPTGASSLLEGWLAARRRERRLWLAPQRREEHPGPLLASPQSDLPLLPRPDATRTSSSDDPWSVTGMLRLLSASASRRGASATPPSQPRVARAEVVEVGPDAQLATRQGLIDATSWSGRIVARGAVGLAGAAGAQDVYATAMDPNDGPSRMEPAVLRSSGGLSADAAAVFRMLHADEASTSERARAVNKGLERLGLRAVQVSAGDTDRAAYASSALLDVPLPSAFGFSRGRYVNAEFGEGPGGRTRISMASGRQGLGSSSTLAVARSVPLGTLWRVSAGLSTTSETNQITGAQGEGLFDTSGQHVRSNAVQLGVSTQLLGLQLRSWVEGLSTQPIELDGAIDSLSAQTAVAGGVSARWNSLVLPGDAVVLGLTLPPRTVSGYANMVRATWDDDGNPVTYAERVSLRPTGMEKVVSMTYWRTLTRISKIEAGGMVRFEPDHIADAKPELALGVRLVFQLY